MNKLIWAAVVLTRLLAPELTLADESGGAAKPAPQVYRAGGMSNERAAHQATLLASGEVLITGGCAGRGCDRILASAELYDPAEGVFRDAAPMSVPRVSHSATLLADGRVLVTGGWTGQQTTAGSEIYDPAEEVWVAAADMTEARASHIAVSLGDGRVLIVGGGDGRLGNLATAEVFEPAAGAFSAVGPMQSNHYLATRLADGRVLVTGGQDATGELLRTAEIFDPATDEFRATGDMTVGRVKHAAALLADGKVLIIGGSDSRGYRERFDSTEIYDPETEEFVTGPPMHWGRHKIRDAVAALPSGAIVVAGGAARPEIYDPSRGTFVAAEGALSGPQMFATATRLTNGEVLILGGYDEHTRSSASAWLLRAR